VIIPVHSICWGCGAEKVEYEDIERELPCLEKWNVCQECIDRRCQNENNSLPDTDK